MQFCRMCYYNVYGCHKPVALLVLVVVFHIVLATCYRPDGFINSLDESSDTIESAGAS
jgi:hypothetical protein